MLYYFTMGKRHYDLRNSFKKFWEEPPKKHSAVMPASLVLKEDATTLFTSSGMQQLVPNLSGEPHPQGKRLYDIQPCFRAVDIDEVGDNRHTTFFEMMGNWSLGDYFKNEQLPWMWDFFTKIVGLPKDKLYVTVFEGGNGVVKDTESTEIWKNLGVKESHIHYYDAKKNWWSRAGTPDKMPPGEIGGPDSEVFYEFTDVAHNKAFGEHCHPNCDCGRFLEIGNSVFIQYRKEKDGTLSELPQKNVDYGGGLERILAASQNDPDIFKTDVFTNIITAIEEIAQTPYLNFNTQGAFRVIADHVKVACFLIKDGVIPSNKEHGYVLRRFLRRAAIKMRQLNGTFNADGFLTISRAVLSTYKKIHFDIQKDETEISLVINDEIKRFSKTIDQGMKQIQKIDTISGKIAFDLYQSFGFPLEITEELAKEKGQEVDHAEFENEFNKHKTGSRTASAGMFKGGLADHSEQVVKYHTATHLLHQALRDVLGNEVRQEGSNITGERLRFDFSYSGKPTDEEVQKVETIINQKIKEKLPVHFEIMPKSKADEIGALSFFREKYGSEVKVYFVGGSTNSPQTAYSKEFCGGPHVENTSVIGSIKITKIKKIGSNLMRVYAE